MQRRSNDTATARIVSAVRINRILYRYRRIERQAELENTFGYIEVEARAVARKVTVYNDTFL